MRKIKNGLLFVLDDVTVFLRNNGDVSVDPPKGTAPSDLAASRKCLQLATLIDSIRQHGYEHKLLIPALERSANEAEFRQRMWNVIPVLGAFKDGTPTLVS